MTKTKYPVVLTASVLMLGSFTWAQEPQKPKYSADVPESILTPDKVETERLGTLEFFDGMPAEETIKKVYDNLDYIRGVEAFLNGMPAAAMYKMCTGFEKVGIPAHTVAISEELLDARTLWLTPNSTTVYVTTCLDLKQGPVVVEIPPGVLGAVNDAFFHWDTDIGVTGPDQGRGGRYLFLPPHYEGPVPQIGFHVVRTRTYRHWVLARAFVIDGDIKAAVAGIKADTKAYLFSEAKSPPKQTFVNFSGSLMNTVHASDVTFYDELNAVVQYEPADTFNPELTGLFASIGIKKGQPFAPDERMKKILTEAAAVGNATARALGFRPRNKSAYYYPDRQWYTGFAGGHDFMNNGELVLDDRIMFHYVATGITPAMATPQVGTGSVYASATKDVKGEHLDGGKTYKVTLPAPIPMNNFWSFMVYSGQHRSMLETDQKAAGLDSNSPSIKQNDDKSYTVWFGPEAPEGHEGNWVQTLPGKSYLAMLRLYGPLEPWFDKTWKPGDLELVE